jgi:hypothetical protein
MLLMSYYRTTGRRRSLARCDGPTLTLVNILNTTKTGLVWGFLQPQRDLQRSRRASDCVRWKALLYLFFLQDIGDQFVK